jgi:hypothetical protein
VRNICWLIEMVIVRADSSPQPPCKVTRYSEFELGVPARGVW